MVNMKNIAHAGPFTKYLVSDDGFVVPDRRYCQGIFRYICGDSRHQLLEFLRALVPEVAEFLAQKPPDDTEGNCASRQRRLCEDQRIKLLQTLPAFRAGLAMLRVTYAQDPVCLYSLDNLIDQTDVMLREVTRLLRARTPLT